MKRLLGRLVHQHVRRWGACLLAAGCSVAGCSEDIVIPPVCTPVSGVVQRVIDGDTIDLEDGTRVRYLLIDTPETATDPADSECFAEEAKLVNEQLVLGREVTLEYDDGQCTGTFGRNLPYVYVGERMINKVLLERGYARTFISRPPEHPDAYKFEDEFLAIEEAAQAEKKGMWGACQ